MFQILVVGFSFKINAEENFETWLSSYKKSALEKGVSQKTIDIAFKNVKFLEQVIKYDRKQPEFFEDTKTYVNKRANISRVKTARRMLGKNRLLFTEVENKFSVEKEILLALWGIETNFGKHVGKMDIISSLATLSSKIIVMSPLISLTSTSSDLSTKALAITKISSFIMTLLAYYHVFI